MERMFKHNSDFILIPFNKKLRCSSFYSPVTTVIIYLQFYVELHLLKFMPLSSPYFCYRKSVMLKCYVLSYGKYNCLLKIRELLQCYKIFCDDKACSLLCMKCNHFLQCIYFPILATPNF